MLRALPTPNSCFLEREARSLNPKPLSGWRVPQGPDLETLTRLKRVMHFAVYMAYRLRLETAFMADECASATAAAVAAELRLAASAGPAHAADKAAAAPGELPVASLVGETAREGAANGGGGIRPRAQAGGVVSGLAGADTMGRSDSNASMIDSVSRMQLSAPLTLASTASSELPEGQKGAGPLAGAGAGPLQKGAASRKLIGETGLLSL